MEPKRYVLLSDYGIEHSGNDPAIGNDSIRAAELVRLLGDARLAGSVLSATLVREMLSCGFLIEDDLLPEELKINSSARIPVPAGFG